MRTSISCYNLCLQPHTSSDNSANPPRASGQFSRQQANSHPDPRPTNKDFSNMRLGSGSRRPESQKSVFSRSGPSLNPQFSVPRWKVGDQCKAPWNDGMYYLATIVNLGPADMCTVRYNDYGNIGTVPQAVLLFV
ncbi:hypothetical protein OSTOST_21172 [Ostertagia ostertagi]